MKPIVSLLIMALVISSCKQSSQIENQKDPELSQLFAMMQGSYSSETQAQEDSTYYNISLHMYPIWKEQGNFLYVEQALSSTQDKPYRQRIYEVKRINEKQIGSYIYTIPNDSLWIGKWKNLENFNKLSFENLELRNGCEVILSKQEDGSFSGSTGEKTCKSSLRGASYATSQVTMTSEMIISWDRGFDKEGKHIWGAKNGGYVFMKL